VNSGVRNGGLHGRNVGLRSFFRLRRRAREPRIRVVEESERVRERAGGGRGSEEGRRSADGFARERSLQAQILF
jgi:hypothetical protein